MGVVEGVVVGVGMGVIVCVWRRRRTINLPDRSCCDSGAGAGAFHLPGAGAEQLDGFAFFGHADGFISSDGTHSRFKLLGL